MNELRVAADIWESLLQAERIQLLEYYGLPPMVMISLDRSTMMYRIREATADDLLEGIGEE